MHDDSAEEEPQQAALVQVAGGALLEALPRLADLFAPGAGVAVGAGGGILGALMNRHATKQTRSLIREVQERVSRLEAQDQLDRERLARLEELGGLQAMTANALAVEEKTVLYADVLAGLVSTEAPEGIDVDSFLATLQTLSVQEIELARQMYDSWERNENAAQSDGIQPGWIGEDHAFHLKRLEGAGLILPLGRTGPPGAGVRISGYELTPTLTRLVQLLRAGSTTSART
jgi:hypothetical protein